MSIIKRLKNWMSEGTNSFGPEVRVIRAESRFAARKPDPKVWEHSCGGQHFYLHESGAIECRSCGEVLSGKTWEGRP